MAWCHQATSHYLNQCQSRSMSPYGISVRSISISLILRHKCIQQFVSFFEPARFEESQRVAINAPWEARLYFTIGGWEHPIVVLGVCTSLGIHWMLGPTYVAHCVCSISGKLQRPSVNCWCVLGWNIGGCLYVLGMTGERCYRSWNI